MADEAGLPWVNYDEAMACVRQIQDPALEQFVMRAVTLVVTEFQQERYPRAPLDMIYFVGILRKMFEQREELARILAGEDLRWWGNEK